MKNIFVILWAPGPAWVKGKTVREQPYWAEHADFMGNYPGHRGEGWTKPIN